jgi:hypothetical protein
MPVGRVADGEDGPASRHPRTSRALGHTSISVDRRRGSLSCAAASAAAVEVGIDDAEIIDAFHARRAPSERIAATVTPAAANAARQRGRGSVAVT